MFLFLFEESWWSGINALWGLLAIVIMVASAILVLLSRRKDETATINEKSAQAHAALVEVRDKQIADLEKRVGVLDEELEEITAEYKTLLSLKVDDLVRWLMFYQDKEAHWRNVEEEMVLLKKQKTEGRDI